VGIRGHVPPQVALGARNGKMKIGLADIEAIKGSTGQKAKELWYKLAGKGKGDRHRVSGLDK